MRDQDAFLRGDMSIRLCIRSAYWIGAVLFFGLPISDAHAAESAKIELHTIQTVTLTDEQFLNGRKDGASTVIAGELRLPRLGTDRLPAMIIVHGSGGIMGNEARWAQELGDIGVATFSLDGFTPRGIVNTATDQSQLGNLTMINDAYRALDLLAKHPRIDPTRIGLMGGSRGGRIALYASLKRFQRLYGTPGLEFAVYLPFYAVCNTRYIDDQDISDRPIRLFHGADDDFTPVVPCRSYVERLRAGGKDVLLMSFTGAHHLFDNPVFPVTQLPQVQTGRNCSFDERSPSLVVNVESGRPYDRNDPCFERGVTLGYNANAHAEAVKALKEILKTVFKLP
jgi:dienelactone hydrolase